ncbi:MAG TPA: hypothetical protein VKY85_16680 [Candidatus Angelobacter sp.]|nr:hypothetical protein [Candidatus Angelobacter sp.]
MNSEGSGDRARSDDPVIRVKSMRAFQFASAVLMVMVLLLSLSSPAQESARPPSTEPSNAFAESAASKLLGQMAEGLQSHSEKKMLSAFDLSLMDGGPTFKEQVTALFNQYEFIRVHFKLVEVKENVAVVNAELDVTPADPANPSQHKNIQLRLTAAKTPAGWKFIDVQPRAFFS